MNILELNPAIAQTIGYNLDQLSDNEKVTVVRRRVVYEEVVMSKEEFEKMNEEVESRDFYLSELEMEDIGFPDLTEDASEYIAFPGDVTSCTDDAIAFLFQNQEWTEQFDTIKIAS
jgi:hypothetical protein